MHDAAIDKIEEMQRMHNMQIEAKKDRQSIELVHDDVSIGAKDRLNNILKDHERFKDV